MCLSQCINHFCPDPKPSHHRPRGLVRFARPPPSDSLPRSSSLPLPLPLSLSLSPFLSSSISHHYPHYLFSSLSHYFRRAETYACTCVRANARAGVRIVEEDRMSGRTAAEMRVTGIGLPVSHPPSPPSPLILPPHPPRGTAAPVCVLF